MELLLARFVFLWGVVTSDVNNVEYSAYPPEANFNGVVYQVCYDRFPIRLAEPNCFLTPGEASEINPDFPLSSEVEFTYGDIGTWEVTVFAVSTFVSVDSLHHVYCDPMGSEMITVMPPKPGAPEIRVMIAPLEVVEVTP